MQTMTQCMRWFGPSDPVSLSDIAQAGATEVVSALHNVPVGELWEENDIREYKARILAKNLDWIVVESLPVHEEIKTRKGKYKAWIEYYSQSLRNLSRQGIKVVTYNFMPLLDWVRTDVAYTLPNGAEALYYDSLDYAAFDLFILKREAAPTQYTEEIKEKAALRFQQMDTNKRKELEQTALLGLPGSEVPFTLRGVKDQLEDYRHLDRQSLRENLILFLKAICPVAESCGISLAIHPDDPPFSVLGLPRTLSIEEDIAAIMESVPSPANGLCFCSGSLGARPDNDLPQILRKWGSRVHFLHLRSTLRDAEGNFMEAEHLVGDADMYALVKEAVQLMQREGRSIPMRPDHGHKMLDDLGKKTYPGYSGIGRLKALAELRGLEYAISRSFLE